MTSQPRSKRIVRARTGCWQCKSRRRKCDEGQPNCKGCMTRGLLCEYGIRLLWEDDAKEAGIAFGRVGMKDRFVKRDSREQSPHFLLPPVRGQQHVFLNTMYADIQRFCSELRPSAAVDQTGGVVKGNHQQYLRYVSKPLQPMTQFPHLDSKSSALYGYYVDILCKRKVLIDDARNPFRHLILPLCLSSEPLLHAVLAVSANDIRNKQDPIHKSWYEEKLLYHKWKSLNALRRSLDFDDLAGRDLIGRDSILLTVLMHCYLEIASGSRHEWHSHLRGAFTVIRHHGKRGAGSADLGFSRSTLQFVIEYFSLRATFSATALDGDDALYKDKWMLDDTITYVSTAQPDGSKINLDTGISQDLLEIISSTTALARRKYRLRAEGLSGLKEEMAYSIAALSLNQRLETLEQWSDEQDHEHLLHLNAAAFKTAAHIYVRHGAFDDSVHDASIQTMLQPRLLHQLKHIHDISGDKVASLPYPMWALFIASGVAKEEHRVIILQLFTKLKECRPFSNVPVTMAAVEAIWKMKDLEVEEKEIRGKKVGFEWDAALAKLGWELSLT